MSHWQERRRAFVKKFSEKDIILIPHDLGEQEQRKFGKNGRESSLCELMTKAEGIKGRGKKAWCGG